MIIENVGVDGSCLHSLTEDDFKEELGVTSKIMLKKIMTCNCLFSVGVQTGFNNFDEHLKNSNKLNFTIKSMSPLKSKKVNSVGSNPKI